LNPHDTWQVVLTISDPAEMAGLLVAAPYTDIVK
jgi:hypothetical protein